MFLLGTFIVWTFSYFWVAYTSMSEFIHFSSADINNAGKILRLVSVFIQKFYRFPKSTEGNLGGWCHTQRKMHKLGKLSSDRRILLDKIGFVWSAEQVWQGNFEQLCLFHNLQGRWPGCREGALGRWCTIQRRDYRKGNMSDERKAQLERIGFPLA